MQNAQLNRLGQAVRGGRRLRKAAPKDGSNRASKKARILELHNAGTTDIADIARLIGTKPSYVASALQTAGLLHGYSDLYTPMAQDQNAYSRFFRNVLSFKNVEAARESAAQIERLYRYFETVGDRAGQHHAELVALTGRNRARWSGKRKEARIFEQWLFNH